MNSNDFCKNIPNLVSSFIDTFVDFSVAGIFLPDPPSPPFSQTTYPPPDRLIAVGDLHGDLSKAQQALRLAGLIDAGDRWSGGSSTLVQVGDVLDKGGEELKILYFLEKLKRQAVRDGGNVITMNGNHEIMNVDRCLHSTAPSGLEEFRNWAYWYTTGSNMKRLCDGLTKPKDIYDGIPSNFPGVKQEYWSGIRARLAALTPKGPIAARFLSKNLTVLVVGESVFVHGGILPEQVDYGLEQINNDVRDWITGLKDNLSSDFRNTLNTIVWMRKFSKISVADRDCSRLEHALATIPGVRRMIMGHTIQTSGINTVCVGKAVRIDVGMSKGCINGLPEVLEICGNSHLKILTSKPVYDVIQEQHEPVEMQVTA
ncbi:putative calcineurin-like phosphoesterase domain, ApaH type [Helianthus annuus]|uniref:Calcineurin-like phosphoesterase domain, ApaH type n=1 Tax=Helianthus annuus TaxID=4232 RepID=A0A9K3E7D6_HELAN|nr:shewanella-like protein phosphatase 2 [Helianthus annuus]KAF5768153.1 putative calcineurin-like phosphoesterase domain, ApaH type [Helianthus annuus]KAJ0839467.1 putative calcineurin-like phosphoesterase domain, ApaH type [Helianthus annuus]KAJ0852814.1 putative calcineurin-like phosphoesterase domain, ApaH type [Helianthus annuus]